MDSKYLIPIAALAVGCAAPDYIGDWELTRFDMENRWAEVEFTVRDGLLAIRPDGDAKLEFEFTAEYSYDYCAYYDDYEDWDTDDTDDTGGGYYDDDYEWECEGEYSTDFVIDTKGDVDDFDGQEFELELDGDIFDEDGYGYWAEFDLDCEAGGQVMKCDGRMRLDGYSQRVELEFRKAR